MELYIRNKLSRTNVLQKPSQDFNSCDDFFELIIISHILTATLKLMGMKSLKDVPSTNTMPEAEMMWMQTSTERKETLDKVCKQVVDRFIYRIYISWSNQY